MKFSTKLLLCTMMLMAAVLGFSGFYFVNYVFESSLEREVRQAMDESSILRFAFETASLNVPTKYDVLPNGSVFQIASNMEAGSQNAGRLLRITDEGRNVLYESEGFAADESLLEQTREGMKTYRVIGEGEDFYIQTASTVNALDRTLYLETLKDVSEVFRDRAMGFSVYRRLTFLMLLLGTLVMHFISSWLTRPVRLLTRATKRMAAGEYDYRARKVSRDELGALTEDFNRMAASLEENIDRLEEEIQAREDFVGAFAHELKTPLTSIIGYADMLRSRKLDGEKSFLSANYIYTEGKRLEAMSIRLLDIIVTRRGEAELAPVSAKTLFSYMQDMFAVREDMEFCFTFEEGTMLAEAGLIETVLVNLLDNACKASEPGGRIEVDGKRTEEGYRFTVTDHGIGIPKKEQARITQAFYMVDKSRSRSRNGAGLGLALCAEILALHGSALEIESEPGKGSRIGFVLRHGRPG